MKTTIFDVAKSAGVSPSAVSNVLNNKPGARINEKTRQRILKAARELNYQPNFAARSFVLQKSFNIGIVVCRSNEYSPFLNFSFAYHILQGIQDVIKDHFYNMPLFLTTNLKEFDYKTLFEKKRVDGLILVQTVNSDLQILEADRNIREYPIIATNNHLEGGQVHYVDVDNQSGIFQAMDHLVKLGYRRIGFINGTLDQSNFVERGGAYKLALENHGFRLDSELIYENPPDYAQVADKWSASGKYPEAIIAANDGIAIGIIKALNDCGLSVPEDIAVVGFDDVETAAHFHPPLTTVRQPMDKIGSIAAEEIIKMLKDKNRLRKQVQAIVRPELIIRESCGATLRSERLLQNRR
ncbi:MAG: LacI family DNA-binding transcriptional regulator [Candidatus Omnitrophota bacterium]